MTCRRGRYPHTGCRQTDRRVPPARQCPTARGPRAGPRPACRGRSVPARAPRERVAPASASSGVRRNSVHAMFSISNSEVAGEVPGLQSVETAIGNAVFAERRDRRQLGLAQSVERARQQHRDRPRPRHRRHACVTRVFEMVGRKRAGCRRECGTAGVRQLVRMQLHGQAMGARRSEHPSRLRGRERDRLAEGIDGIRGARAARPQESCRGKRVDIVVGSPGKFRRQRVRRKQRRAHVDAELPAPASARPRAASFRSPYPGRSRT